MPSIVRWKPSTAPNIVLYTLMYSDTGASGPFLDLQTVPNVPQGPYYDTDAALFTYTDNADIAYRLYRLRMVDTQGNVFDDTSSPPFGPNNDPYTLPVPNTYPLDENYGGDQALAYVTPDGDPVADAAVRVYRKTDWDLRQYSKVVGLTRTTSTGGWFSPILVEPGNDFVVLYHLPDVYGPDTVEITV